jgi:GNAT superfamily N-acetyltransferase
MDTPLTIRDARPDEAAVYTAFARAIFIRTYAAGNEPRLLANHVASSFSEAFQRAELLDPERRVLVIDAPDGGWGAFASLRANHVPHEVDAVRAVEVERFYVGEHWHGRGVAHVLMDAVVDRARADGVDTLWLGVWTHNLRAIRFYEKMGFVQVGTHPFVFGGEPEDDVLMARRL